MGMTWLIAAALLAHAAIHASFIAPRPPVTAGGSIWPFELGRFDAEVAGRASAD